jgi:hypothetical protein
MIEVRRAEGAKERPMDCEDASKKKAALGRLFAASP